MEYENEEMNIRRQKREAQQNLLRKQMKVVKIGFGITLAITACCCLLMLAAVKGWFPFAQDVTPSQPQLGTEPTETEPVPTETEPPKPDTVIHLVAGGDVNVTDGTVASGKTDTGYDFTKAFLDLVPILSGGDLTVLNFEGNLYGAPYGAGSAPQELVQALANAGVDLLQTANSKSVDKGMTGLRDTINGIRGAGMEPLGTFADPEEFQKSGGFYMREVQGVRIAFVAFTKGMDGQLALPAGSEDCVNLLYEDYYSAYQKVNKDGIRSVLQAVEDAKPDITVALVHWGSEYNDNLSKTQETIVKLMQEEGVDAILGTHSHYVQSMVFDEAAGTFTAYSLGDFYGDAQRAGTNYSVLLDLQITKDGTTGETKITGFEYIPIYIYRDEAGSIRVLRLREAIAAYESNIIGKVPEEVYTQMKSALSRIESRVTPKT